MKKLTKWIPLVLCVLGLFMLVSGREKMVDISKTGAFVPRSAVLDGFTIQVSDATTGEVLGESNPFSIDFGEPQVPPTPKSVVITLNVVASPDFQIAVSPTTLSCYPSGSGVFNFALTPMNGFTGTVRYTIGTLPAGVTAVFVPTDVNAGTPLSVLTITLPANQPVGPITLTVTATAL